MSTFHLCTREIRAIHFGISEIGVSQITVHQAGVSLPMPWYALPDRAFHRLSGTILIAGLGYGMQRRGLLRMAALCELVVKSRNDGCRPGEKFWENLQYACVSDTANPFPCREPGDDRALVGPAGFEPATTPL